MIKSEIFREFLRNLTVDNAEQISLRYGEITGSLNNQFRNTDSKTKNSLRVGSYGRCTAIKGISDLDMLYIMPKASWDDYKDGKQSQLLTDTKNAIQARYPKTKVYVDRLVVGVRYKNFHVEVQPVFAQEDGSKYPDTYQGGAWKSTKPREEMNAMKEFELQKNENLRRLCRMTRAWKNQHGVSMGGLLIDTLAHNFLKLKTEYDNKSFHSYDVMSRDFFKYLAEQPNQEYYAALGSGQRVKVKQKFQRQAKKAYDLCVKAIEAQDQDTAYTRWKKIYGRQFPAKPVTALFGEHVQTWRNTEEYIEDKYSVDIRYNLRIDCNVSQNGFREDSLFNLLQKGLFLSPQKKLKFRVVEFEGKEESAIYWKVLNRGSEAKRRDMIRGKIIPDSGDRTKIEETCFQGEHIVECYAVENDVVVAKDRIHVPIR